MRKTSPKHQTNRVTKGGAALFSICTNDSNPDTLAVDRTHKAIAGFRSTALLRPLERRARPEAKVLESASGATRWVESLLITMLRFSVVVSDLSVL
jgi:hypothetical protein